MVDIADHLHDLGIEKGFLNETQNALTRQVKSRREAPSSSRQHVQGPEKVAAGARVTQPLEENGSLRQSFCESGRSSSFKQAQ